MLDQPLNNWLGLEAHASNVGCMSWMFSNVEYMSSMFYEAKSFNQPLDNWNVSNLICMCGKCNIFCQDLKSRKLLRKKSIEIKEFELDKECHICQNNETNNSIIKVNCCNNNYHKDCLIKWLNINKTCPTCRNEF